ncbi:glucose-fructose oxidoreductase [Christiangramia fulva]|uniref:Glucose-fructose oxidoreductase n=1 Tax=Christiangramia fulva TaxID=2126553 RepID=A0A2R3ZA09_9FLAO|nr:Gfo/Idh/MocA family oxidoreductase [Christiangramia fulva]AVR47024.1 glucose-fructose oxidoreductase [Christiangramia fulva]
MDNRRTFLKKSGLFLTASLLPFPYYKFRRSSEKLGVALLGLGNYSTGLLAPALQQTENCELRGIITGSPEKIPLWQKKYGIKDRNVYNYENMHQLANNEEIDVVYVVTPNSLHPKYAVIAANAGKHIWCEKPMARTSRGCREIIEACNKNNRKLSIGYRMQHEKNTKQIMEWAKTKPYGSIQKLTADAGFYGGSNLTPWRLEKEMGGGAIYDMGVYCINGARYSTNLEPVALSATQSTTRPNMFDEVDETTKFTLEFPNGITAHCKTSFGENINRLEVTCENGWYYLDPMQSYSGVQGKTSDGKILRPMQKMQQAVQMDDDALAILNGKPVMVPSEEGLKDVIIVEKINESAAKGGKRMLL